MIHEKHQLRIWLHSQHAAVFLCPNSSPWHGKSLTDQPLYSDILALLSLLSVKHLHILQDLRKTSSSLWNSPNSPRQHESLLFYTCPAEFMVACVIYHIISSLPLTHLSLPLHGATIALFIWEAHFDLAPISCGCPMRILWPRMLKWLAQGYAACFSSARIRNQVTWFPFQCFSHHIVLFSIEQLLWLKKKIPQHLFKKFNIDLLVWTISLTQGGRTSLPSFRGSWTEVVSWSVQLLEVSHWWVLWEGLMLPILNHPDTYYTSGTLGYGYQSNNNKITHCVGHCLSCHLLLLWKGQEPGL